MCGLPDDERGGCGWDRSIALAHEDEIQLVRVAGQVDDELGDVLATAVVHERHGRERHAHVRDGVAGVGDGRPRPAVEVQHVAAPRHAALGVEIERG